MIDLHTHTLFSDGELLPSELVRRAEITGYQAVALTDHADSSNLDWIIPRIVQACRDLNAHWKIRAIPGIELTHLPPEIIGLMVEKARILGARLVVVHGETMVEPVPPGTNRKALEAGADILAHRGLISEGEVFLARELELCYAAVCYVVNFAEGVKDRPYRPGVLSRGWPTKTTWPGSKR